MKVSASLSFGVASALALATSCVKITDDCGALRISPSGGAGVAGSTLSFTASMNGMLTPCNWKWSEPTAYVLPRGIGRVDVLTTAFVDNFTLRATIPMTGETCLTQISMVDISGTTFSLPPFMSPSGATEMSVFSGAVAVGGRPVPTALGPGPSGEFVYVATLILDSIATGSTELVNKVERYSLADVQNGNFTPQYSTADVAKFSTGFSESFGPNIAADAAGNGYWFGGFKFTSIYRIQPTQVQSQPPQVQSLSNIPGLSFVAPRLAADSQSRIYFPGIYTPQDGSAFQGYLRVTGLFTGGPITVDPIIQSNIFESALQIAIDPEDRVIVTKNGLLLRYVEVSPASYQQDVDDPDTDEQEVEGFDAVAALLEDGANLVNQISDLDVDGHGMIYVTIALEVGYQVRVLNAGGKLIRKFTVVPDSNQPLDALFSFAASLGGTLLFFDGVDGSDAGEIAEQGLLTVFDPDAPQAPPDTGIGF